MKCVPLYLVPRPSYPRWGTGAARSVRRLAVVGASAVILSVLGCAGSASTSSAAETPTVEEDIEAEPVTEIAEVEVTPEIGNGTSNASVSTDDAHSKAQSRQEREPGHYDEWIRIPVKIIFEQGSDLDESDHAMLQELMASVVQRTDVIRIRVEGYAIPEWEANHQGLAMARAEKVVDYLVIEGGMSRQFFELVDAGGGYSDAGAMDRVQWQRVEFVALIRRSRVSR